VPTVETIRDGTYPYANNFYAITTNKTANNPHVRELIAWFLSPQGQKLIDDTGYVSLGKTPQGVQTAYIFPWQFLYFLPLPQGQGSLRPTFGISRRMVTLGRVISSGGFSGRFGSGGGA